MPKPNPKLPNIILCEIPHKRPGPREGDPFQNSTSNSQPPPDVKTRLVKDHPPPPSTSPISKPDPNVPNITLCESPHGSHISKQGNPRPNYKTNPQPPPDETTPIEEYDPNPPTLWFT